MNKNLSNKHTNSSLQLFSQPTISLDKFFQKDEIKNYASALAKRNIEKRVKGQ